MNIDFFTFQFRHSVMSDSAQPQGLQHARPHCPSPTLGAQTLKLMFIESVMPSNHLILCHPLLPLPSIFPSIRVFSDESALHIRWPKYWSFSFSISPSNEYSRLVWSACSPRDSEEFSLTLQFKSIISSVLSHLYGSTPTSVHDYWKNHSFLCDIY